ncbi:MAG: hypothetical protein ACRBFS_01865 [Aureispira sp.]
MPNSNQILDTPEIPRRQKIRKPYFWIFELGTLGCLFFLCIFTLPLIGNVLNDSETSILETILTLIIYSIVSITTLTAPIVFLYRWHKASLKYDRTLNKEIAKNTLLELLEEELLGLSIAISFLAIIVETCFLIGEYDRLTPYQYYITLSAVLFFIISLLYFSIITRTIKSVLK